MTTTKTNHKCCSYKKAFYQIVVVYKYFFIFGTCNLASIAYKYNYKLMLRLTPRPFLSLPAAAPLAVEARPRNMR